MKDLYQQSIALHQKHGGKIATEHTVPLETTTDLSLAYTPGVAGVCREIAQHPARVHELTIKKNTVAIVSDGSAVLGLGNIGPEAAIPVMEGKAALFKKFADINAFPLCLDTQDPEEIISIVKNIAPVFGGINLEDISAPRCFAIEERLRAMLDIPVMHDDQHGTATVVLAGLINALRLRGGDEKNVKVVLSGAGSAGVAIAKILLSYGIKNVTACDRKGVLCHERDDLNETKQRLVAMTNPERICGTLADIIVDADVFIGVSAPGVLTQEMIQTMHKKPIIFALANPEPEIMPEEALAAGAFIVATGRSDFPNQVNNVLAFPGLFRGILGSGKQFDETVFVRAAQAIASCVEHPTPQKIIPGVFEKDVVHSVARVV